MVDNTIVNDWNPWEYAATHYPHITICTKAPLPTGRKGATDHHSTIWLSPDLDQAGRRFTLTHELMHLDRGRVPAAMRAKEEAIVDLLAARLLVPLHRLIDVSTRVEDLRAAARALWVSPYGLKVRLLNLTDEERTLLTEARRGELAS